MVNQIYKALARSKTFESPTSIGQELEQLDIVHRRRHHDTATRNRQFFLGHIGARITVEPLNEGPPGMGFEQNAPGKTAAQILAGLHIALVEQELTHEFDILGPDIVERRIDLAAAENLDLEIAFAP